MLRYKEANRLLKAKEEELRRELEDELHSSGGWKREKERLETRIGQSFSQGHLAIDPDYQL